LRRALAVATGISVASLTFFACGPTQTVSSTGPGTSSQLYLTATKPKMVVEIAPIVGRTPDPDAVTLLLQRALDRCYKPGGITAVVDPAVASVVSGTHLWSLDDLHAFEQANRKVQPASDTAVLWVAYLDGFYAANSLVVGIAYDDHSVAVFKDVVPSGVNEGPVLVHELGHELGLVDGTAAMITPHEDTAHPRHDTNPQCVMYFSLDLGADGTAPDDYDDNCKADLKAAGGK
jgi:hypothetical protein